MKRKHKGDNIVLIGMMGSGKSSVGVALSHHIGWDFVDFDTLIEETQKRTISEIFATEGEEYFRNLESNILKDFKGKHVIIATGGGIVEREENLNLLEEMGVTVYLEAPAQELYKRVQKETHRPLAQDEESFTSLLERRKPLYECAEHTINTERKRTHEIVEEIYEKMNESNEKACFRNCE